jgi:hypothetical protein
MAKSCRQCSTEFEVAGTHYQVFCSKKCQYKYWNHQRPEGFHKKQYASGAKNRKLLYGLEESAYQALLHRQKGLCAACLLPLEGNKMIGVDHDHSCCPGKRTCGKCTRGILHRACNSALGAFKDSPQLLRNAAQYLEDYGTSS